MICFIYYEFLVDLNIWSLRGRQHLLRVVAEVPVAHGGHHSEEEIYDSKKSCEFLVQHESVGEILDCDDSQLKL